MTINDALGTSTPTSMTVVLTNTAVVPSLKWDITAFFSVEGIRAISGNDAGVVIGWTHYLAFDLFIGLWIARDADAKGFGRIAQFPFLFLTLMVGPVGLFLWLIVRERRARAQAKA